MLVWPQRSACRYHGLSDGTGAAEATAAAVVVCKKLRRVSTVLNGAYQQKAPRSEIQADRSWSGKGSVDVINGSAREPESCRPAVLGRTRSEPRVLKPCAAGRHAPRDAGR